MAPGGALSTGSLACNHAIWDTTTPPERPAAERALPPHCAARRWTSVASACQHPGASVPSRKSRTRPIERLASFGRASAVRDRASRVCVSGPRCALSRGKPGPAIRIDTTASPPLYVHLPRGSGRHPAVPLVHPWCPHSPEPLLSRRRSTAIEERRLPVESRGFRARAPARAPTKPAERRDSVTMDTDRTPAPWVRHSRWTRFTSYPRLRRL
jgi:hypothetical protein